jgi:hypothetical protein
MTNTEVDKFVAKHCQKDSAAAFVILIPFLLLGIAAAICC